VDCLIISKGTWLTHVLLAGTVALPGANERFPFWPANWTCALLGLQVALDESNNDTAVMQVWLAVSSL